MIFQWKEIAIIRNSVKIKLFKKLLDVGGKTIMDKVVSKVVALGVPGLVLLISMGATGFAGAAAITTALAALGPAGMLGGIATLGIIGLLSQSITTFGIDAIFAAVVTELCKKGETKESIVKKIDGYLISKSLKRKLKEKLEKA